MLSSVICCTVLSAALFGARAWPPAIILSGIVFVLYSRIAQFEWADTANMHTFTTEWILRLIAEYPVTADPAVYSRLNRELGMRFSRRADLVSVELRKYKFDSRYFAELPLCNYPAVRKYLIRHGVYQIIRDAASCLGLLGGSMMAEYRQRYATRRGWPVQPAWLFGCIAESLPESGVSANARSVVLNLHGPLSFIVCTVCHPVQCPADFTADMSASESAETSKSGDFTADMSASESADMSVETSADMSVETSADMSVETSADMSVETSADMSVETSADMSAETSADMSASESVDVSADASACGAQMYASWVAWTAGILPVWHNDRDDSDDEYAVKVAQLTTEYAHLGDTDVAHCNAIGAVVHNLHDAATHTSLRRVLSVCIAVYMPPVFVLAYLSTYLM